MGYYIHRKGYYYEGDMLKGSIPVPKRPSLYYNWSFVNSQWEEDVPRARKEVYQDIVDEVGITRLRYVVSTATQSGTYIDKAKEAEAYRTAGYPVPLDTALYPYIDGSSRARALTPQQAADFITGEYERLRRLNGQQVEYLREQASMQIDAAITVAEVETIRTRAINALRAV